MLAHAPEAIAPWLQVVVTPVSGDSVVFTVDILSRAAGESAHLEQAAEEKPTHQRTQLSLAPRSKPVASNAWEERDMGAGGNQWGRLNVDADRKKKRCAECTRPLPYCCTLLLCERCTGQTPQGTVVSNASLEAAEPSAPTSTPPLKASPFKTPEAANAMPPGLVLPSSNPASATADVANTSKVLSKLSVNRPWVACSGWRIGGV